MRVCVASDASIYIVGPINSPDKLKKLLGDDRKICEALGAGKKRYAVNLNTDEVIILNSSGMKLRPIKKEHDDPKGTLQRALKKE